MSPGVVDALVIILKVFGVIIAIDVLIFIFMCRVSVFKRNIARREKEERHHDDMWFSDAGQKELYRDFPV